MATEKQKNSMKLAILAKCYDCTGQGADGRVDCRNVGCPLYKWMPYRESEPTNRDLDMYLESRPKRTMTDEQKQAAAERLAAGRAKKQQPLEEK